MEFVLELVWTSGVSLKLANRLDVESVSPEVKNTRN